MLFTLAFAAFVLVVTPGQASDAFFRGDFIFDAQAEAHGHVHASCIVELPNGDLLAVWYENGPADPGYYYSLDRDKSDNVRIGGARRGRGAGGWGKPFVMADTYGVSDNNPALLVDRQKRLWLIFPTLLAVPQRTWGSSLLQFKVSTDFEKPGRPRWDKTGILVVHPKGLDEVVARYANELRRGADRENNNDRRARMLLERLSDPFARRLGWMPRAHPLARRDGTVLIPFSNENFNAAAMALTDDGGETWTISRAVPGVGVTQPSVVEFPDGKLVAFFRDATGRRKIQRSESRNGGLTWSEVASTELPNPGAGIEAVLLRNGHLAMIYNPLIKSPRDKLAISISEDAGKTWKWTRLIEDQPGGRFDYPSLIQAADGTLHATYSFHLKTVKHVQFNESWVREGP